MNLNQLGELAKENECDVLLKRMGVAASDERRKRTAAVANDEVTDGRPSPSWGDSRVLADTIVIFVTFSLLPVTQPPRTITEWVTCHPSVSRFCYTLPVTRPH